MTKGCLSPFGVFDLESRIFRFFGLSWFFRCLVNIDQLTYIISLFLYMQFSRYIPRAFLPVPAD
jgi:hypothetical protein